MVATPSSQQLHEHRADQRHHLLLRRVRGERRRGERQLRASERDAAGTAARSTDGLTATAGNGQVALSWTASTGATSYNVKRATVSGGPYTMVADTYLQQLHRTSG